MTNASPYSNISSKHIRVKENYHDLQYPQIMDIARMSRLEAF